MARIILFLLLASFFLSGWAFSEVSKTNFKNPNSKKMWQALTVLLPIIGAILFFQQRKNKNG